MIPANVKKFGQNSIALHKIFSLVRLCFYLQWNFCKKSFLSFSILSSKFPFVCNISSFHNRPISVIYQSIISYLLLFILSAWTEVDLTNVYDLTIWSMLKHLHKKEGTKLRVIGSDSVFDVSLLLFVSNIFLFIVLILQSPAMQIIISFMINL